MTPPAAPMSAADREAHEAGSYVHRTATVSQETVTLPAAPAARPPASLMAAAEQPRENKVVSEPATPDACKRDYVAAADVRAQLARQEARRRR